MLLVKSVLNNSIILLLPSSNIFKTSEIKSIKDIISDFFQINAKDDIINYINIANTELEKSSDIFEFGLVLNDAWNYQDKIDFVCCMFEVSLIDGDMYYLEEHLIKKVSNILNVNHKDLIKSKVEIKRIFNID